MPEDFIAQLLDAIAQPTNTIRVTPEQVEFVAMSVGAALRLSAEGSAPQEQLLERVMDLILYGFDAVVEVVNDDGSVETIRSPLTPTIEG